MGQKEERSGPVSVAFHEGYGALRELCRRLGLDGGCEEDVSEEQRFLSLALRRGETEIGMASGVYSPGEDAFRIMAVQILVEGGLRELTFHALRTLIAAARERFGAHLLEWVYEWPGGKRDPHPDILARLGLPWLGSPMREVLGHRIFARSEKLSESFRKHNRPFLNEESMARQGFAALPFAEADRAILDGMREFLASPAEDTEGLSPFVGAGGYDPELSFVSVDVPTGAVAGWVVCRPYGNYIELRRFYVGHRFRRRMLGQFLGALMLRLIQEKSEGLVFLVRKERTSMQKFIQGYLKDTIAASYDLCRVTAKFQSFVSGERGGDEDGGA